MAHFESHEYAQFRSQQTALRSGKVRRCPGCGGKIGPGRCVLCGVRSTKANTKKPGGFVDGDRIEANGKARG